MARIRTIKPELWTDEKLTECSLGARLLFIGMLNFADDNGNLQRSSKKIKMQVFPADSIDCEPLLAELFAHGVLREYSVNNEKFIHISGFRKHQVINRPSASNIPHIQIPDDSVSTHGVVTEGREGKGKEGNGKEGNGGDKDAPDGESPKGSKSRKTQVPENFSISERVASWAKTKGHNRLEERLEHFVSRCKMSDYRYVDWDEAFMTAVRDDWAKLPPIKSERPKL